MIYTPGITIKQLVGEQDTLLSLCCGIATELKELPKSVKVTAVDIVPEYLAEINKEYPRYKTVLSDAVEYAAKVGDKSFDIVSCIDGIEHLSKENGLKLIVEMKRIAKKKVLLFTPQGYVRNEPKHTWGIDGGDHYQLHLSGWTPEEVLAHGYEIAWESDAESSLGDKYKEAFYVYSKY